MLLPNNAGTPLCRIDDVPVPGRLEQVGSSRYLVIDSFPAEKTGIIDFE